MTEDVYGDFRVQRILGQGAMGMVYRAYDPRLDRVVALKLVHPARIAKDAVKARARLIAEARALACVSHPNVLAVYDIGEHDDIVYVALELVDGARDARRTAGGSTPRRCRGGARVRACRAGNGVAAAACRARGDQCSCTTTHVVA
jgi:eukaryotic-like serine/threonine-protein kinase